MTTIEILALIIALFAAIKIIVILANPKSWMSVVRFVYAKPKVTMVVALVLAALVLNYLLTMMTIVDIFAVMVFLVLVSAISAAAYSKDVVPLAAKMLRDRNVLKKAWLALVVWIVLIIWVLYELFLVA